jgi:hypothetical protein
LKDCTNSKIMLNIHKTTLLFIVFLFRLKDSNFAT